MNEWKRRRVLRELSQAEVARRIGRAQSWVSAVVEGGGRKLTDDERAALRKVLGGTSDTRTATGEHGNSAARDG